MILTTYYAPGIVLCTLSTVSHGHPTLQTAVTVPFDRLKKLKSSEANPLPDVGQLVNKWFWVSNQAQDRLLDCGARLRGLES